MSTDGLLHLMAVFQKTFYADDPLFADAKVVFSIYGEEFEEQIGPYECGKKCSMTA